MFDLAFISDVPEIQDGGWLALRGRTVLGDFSEEFLAALGPWDRATYERHWIEAAGRLLGGAERAGFFMSAYQFWWTAWRAGDFVFVQEQLLLASALHAPPFDPANVHAHVGERRTDPDEDGHTPSEWRLTIRDLREFVARREAQYVPA